NRFCQACGWYFRRKKSVEYTLGGTAPHVTMEFLHSPDKVMTIMYWCTINDETTFGNQAPLQELKDNPCF
ncbi:MAG: hypothetical protein J4F36_13520, partial [Nitrosopumilaceae archaeon]|nr:hypothetical protein [Nitrosopumilaceae archaeon]